MNNNGIINDIDKPEVPDYGKGPVGEVEGRFDDRYEEYIERYETTERRMTSDKKNLILGLVGGVISTFVVAGCVLSFLYFLNADKRQELKTAGSDSSYSEEKEEETDEKKSKDEKEETTTKKAEKTTAESTTESTTKATTTTETTTEEVTERDENRQEDYNRPDPYRETQPTEPYYAVSRSKMYSDDYILPSDIRYLTTSDLDKFSYYEMDYVTNEIYARHGYIFQTEKFADYFEARSWYTPSNRSMSDVENKFSTIEKANIEFIVSYEKAKGWRESTQTTKSYNKPDREPQTTVTTTRVTTTVVEIPDVVGEDFEVAKNMLIAQGCKIEVLQDYSDEPKGIVIAQKEVEGRGNPRDTIVAITVSLGPEVTVDAESEYHSFLAEHSDEIGGYAIADVTGDGESELLLENWNGYCVVYTFDTETGSMEELVRNGLAKGSSMQMYYSSQDCAVILPSASTGGSVIEVVEFSGESSYSAKTFEYKNGKHSYDGNNHYYIDGVEVNIEEYESERDSLINSYNGVDLTY